MGSDLLHADDTPIRVWNDSLRDKGLGKASAGTDLGLCGVTSAHGGGCAHLEPSIGF